MLGSPFLWREWYNWCSFVISLSFLTKKYKFEIPLPLPRNLKLLNKFPFNHKIKMSMKVSHLCCVIESRFPRNVFQLGGFQLKLKTLNWKKIQTESLTSSADVTFTGSTRTTSSGRTLSLVSYQIWAKVWLFLKSNWYPHEAWLLFYRFQSIFLEVFERNISKTAQLSKVFAFSIEFSQRIIWKNVNCLDLFFFEVTRSE